MKKKQEIKSIVVIDNFEPTLTTTCDTLKKQKFDVVGFQSLDEAIDYIQNNNVDLIISDLIIHSQLNGCEFMIDHLIEKKIEFACFVHQGSDDVINKNELGLFFEGLPDHFKILYDFKKSLNQDQVDLIIKDFKKNKKTKLPLFKKESGLSKLLKYFNQN